MGLKQGLNERQSTQNLVIKNRNISALIESAAELMLIKGKFDETLLQAIKDTAHEIKEDMADLALEYAD